MMSELQVTFPVPTRAAPCSAASAARCWGRQWTGERGQGRDSCSDPIGRAGSLGIFFKLTRGLSLPPPGAAPESEGRDQACALSQVESGAHTFGASEVPVGLSEPCQPGRLQGFWGIRGAGVLPASAEAAGPQLGAPGRHPRGRLVGGRHYLLTRAAPPVGGHRFCAHQAWLGRLGAPPFSAQALLAQHPIAPPSELATCQGLPGWGCLVSHF